MVEERRVGGEGINWEISIDIYTLLLLQSRVSCVRLCATHRQQPTRLLCPWDSPGKNTGVGCHFLLQCMKVKSESEVTQSCLTLSDPMDYSPPGSSVGDSNFSFQLAYLWITRKTIHSKCMHHKCKIT